MILAFQSRIEWIEWRKPFCLLWLSGFSPTSRTSKWSLEVEPEHISSLDLKVGDILEWEGKVLSRSGDRSGEKP